MYSASNLGSAEHILQSKSLPLHRWCLFFRRAVCLETGLNSYAC